MKDIAPSRERPDEPRNTTLVALLAIVAVIAVSFAVWRNRPADSSGPAAPSVADGDLTIAFTGDTVVTQPFKELQASPGFGTVARRLRESSLAVTNLEMTLFQRPPDRTSESDAWPNGTRMGAATLHETGFDVVSRANNRAADHGGDGVIQTGAVLDDAGLRHVGAGRDLASARAPLVMRASNTDVAFFAVAVSSSPESRATDARGEIAGRPGVNPLRFDADITVDEQTFATLKASAPVLQADAATGERELTLFGRSIKRGEKTVVTFTIDAVDQAAILDAIAAARRRAAIVVVAIHSHEPSNHSDVPADFVRAFAAQAIEHGASLIVGHGPHRLRGIEARPGGVILYSLGNFLYPYEPLATRAADLFDSGVDLYGLALGAIAVQERRTPAPMEAPEWWESVIAVASFSKGALTALRVYPIDLGTDRAAERRGVPQPAEGQRATAILTRLAALSKPFATTLDLANGVATVNMEPQRAR